MVGDKNQFPNALKSSLNSGSTAPRDNGLVGTNYCGSQVHHGGKVLNHVVTNIEVHPSDA